MGMEKKKNVTQIPSNYIVICYHIAVYLRYFAFGNSLEILSPLNLQETHIVYFCDSSIVLELLQSKVKPRFDISFPNDIIEQNYILKWLYVELRITYVKIPR